MVVQEAFDRIVWEKRLDESLALLDQAISAKCDCDPEWEKGTFCVQCYARKIQRWVQDGGVSNAALQDAVEDVLCRIDDTSEVVFSPEHPVEAIRFWSQQ